MLATVGVPGETPVVGQHRGEESSVVGVARRYRDVVAAQVIDEADADLAAAVADAGARAVVAPMIMSSPQAAAADDRFR